MITVFNQGGLPKDYTTANFLPRWADEDGLAL